MLMRAGTLQLVDPEPMQEALCASCEVRSLSLFGALEEDGLARIQTRIRTMTLQPEQRVYGLGHPGHAVYTVRSGIVRFERPTQSGEKRVVRLAGPGDLIGQEALVGRPYADDAVACTPVTLCRLPRTTVDGLAQTESKLVRELMLRSQLALEAAATWVAEMSTGPARRRLLQLLAKLADYAEPDGTAWLPSRDQIGCMLDMRIETASREISRLKREGVITIPTLRTVRIDLPGLRAALQAAEAA